MRRLFQFRRLRAITITRLLRWSAVLTMIALALMVWSMLQPTPLPVMLAMSLGQLLGTMAFALYGVVILRDLRRVRRERRDSERTHREPVAEPKAGT